MQMKVLIIIVTFNRVNLLKRCLKYCLNQNYKNFEILIIDNCSNDGTTQYLKENNFNYIKLKYNSGSAGGWYEGIKFALDKNYDFVWLMDDDGFPQEFSLDRLMNKYEKSYSCISSLVVSENNKGKLVFPMPKFSKRKLNISFLTKFTNTETLKKYSKKNIYDFAHLFNGSLIEINKIKRIGNINKEYFMYGDELDYYFRLKKIGKVVTCLESLHFHPDVSNRKCSKFWVYYYLKNSIIINYKYNSFSFFRSLIIILLCLIRVFYRNGIIDFLKMIFSNKYNFYKAIYFGFRNKLGNDS